MGVKPLCRGAKFGSSALVKTGDLSGHIIANLNFPSAVITIALIGLVLALIYLFRMAPMSREEVTIARADPPVRKPDDPAYIHRRARAAAVAMVLHRKRHSRGDLDEDG